MVTLSEGLEAIDAPTCACGCGRPVTRSKIAPYGWNTYWGRHTGRTGVGSQRVERTCEVCGHLFIAWRHRAGAARFCGYACYWAHGQQPEHKQALFWSRVEKTDACWWWRGTLLNTGYGIFRVGGKGVGAHRYAWEATNGPIADGLLVCHSCDVGLAPGDISYRRCVNPSHLWLGTTHENMLDMSAKGRGRQPRKSAH